MIPLRAIVKRLSVVAALLALSLHVRALEPNDWKNRQTVAIDRAGLVKLTLPPATLDAARPSLEDLRLLDPAGRETPFLIEHAAATKTATTQSPRSFRATLAESATQLAIETGTTAPLTQISVATPSPTFLKAARVETSADGQQWQELRNGVPLFRQFGAEQVTIDLDRRPAAQVRITVDDARSQPVPFTGAMLFVATKDQPAPASALTSARLARREEFSGETVLTLDLGARNVPLAAMTIVATDPVFTRKVSLLARELRNETAFDQTLAGGTVYRMAIDGFPSSEKLAIPLAFKAPGRELMVRIENGDSPPLTIERVEVQQHPTWIVFSAPAPGTYTLLTGNSDIAAPRYDLSTFATTLKTVAPAPLTIAPPEPNPGYTKRDSLADVPLLGAAIDVSGWRWHKAVQLGHDGVQQLELDVDVLANVENGGADLRLVRERTQLPYIVERPALTRTLSLAVAEANDSKRPRFSRWQLKLPQARMPIVRFLLASPTPLFQRELRLYQMRSGADGSSYEQTLATLPWNKGPADKRALDVLLGVAPASDTLWLETDNGDNPSIALENVKVSYPVVRLLFKTNAGPLDLYYGNRDAAAPRYDIALIADQIMAAEKNVAALPRMEAATSRAEPGFVATRAGILFWAALSLVVIVLLVVVARLLPKPPAA